MRVIRLFMVIKLLLELLGLLGLLCYQDY
jgi:hypothetical protein